MQAGIVDNLDGRLDRQDPPALGVALLLEGFKGPPLPQDDRLLEDDQSLVIEIVDDDARLRAFVAELADISGIGLITLEFGLGLSG